MSPGDAAATAVSVFVQGAVGVAKKHPKVTSTWAFGLALMVLGTGFTVSQSLRTEYENSMQDVDAQYSGALSERQRDWARADARYRQSQGWFWSCDRVCQRAKLDADDARRALDGVLAQERAAVSDIKSKVGVMSVYGVQEARDLFWGTFAGGEKPAQRQSMWDLLFMGLNSTRRDENMLGVILKWVVQLLFNFTLGLCGALVVFVCKLWSVITTYQVRRALCVARGVDARRDTRATFARRTGRSHHGARLLAPRCHHRRIVRRVIPAAHVRSGCDGGPSASRRPRKRRRESKAPGAVAGASSTSRAGRIMIEGGARSSAWKSRSCARVAGPRRPEERAAPRNSSAASAKRTTRPRGEISPKCSSAVVSSARARPLLAAFLVIRRRAPGRPDAVRATVASSDSVSTAGGSAKAATTAMSVVKPASNQNAAPCPRRPHALTLDAYASAPERRAGHLTDRLDRRGGAVRLGARVARDRTIRHHLQGRERERARARLRARRDAGARDARGARATTVTQQRRRPRRRGLHDHRAAERAPQAERAHDALGDKGREEERGERRAREQRADTLEPLIARPPTARVLMSQSGSTSNAANVHMPASARRQRIARSGPRGMHRGCAARARRRPRRCHRRLRPRRRRPCTGARARRAASSREATRPRARSVTSASAAPTTLGGSAASPGRPEPKRPYSAPPIAGPASCATEPDAMTRLITLSSPPLPSRSPISRRACP